MPTPSSNTCHQDQIARPEVAPSKGPQAPRKHHREVPPSPMLLSPREALQRRTSPGASKQKVSNLLRRTLMQRSLCWSISTAVLNLKNTTRDFNLSPRRIIELYLTKVLSQIRGRVRIKLIHSSKFKIFPIPNILLQNILLHLNLQIPILSFNKSY